MLRTKEIRLDVRVTAVKGQKRKLPILVGYAYGWLTVQLLVGAEQ